MNHTRTSLLTLLSRQFGGQRAAATVIIATVVCTAFLAAAAPRARDELVSRELGYEISGLPAATRDLSASPVGVVSLEEGSTVDEVWGATVRSVSEIRDSVPEAARGLLGDGHVVATTGALSTGMSGYRIGPSDPVSRIGLVAGPEVLDHVRMVAGAAPEPADAMTAIALQNSRGAQAGDPDLPIDIALSSSAANTLNWSIGQVRKASPEITNHAPYFRLTGIFEATEPTADYWQHLPSTTLAADTFDDGNRRPIATATAIVSPLTWPTISAIYNYGPTTIQRLTVWYPVNGQAITGANATNVRDELRQTAARVVSIGEDGAFLDAPRSAFTTSVVDRLETALDRSDATTAVLLVAASGPLGVAIAVLALASRLITQRRRDTLSLVASRGGSDRQLRGVLAVEGLLYGVPAAIAGVVIAAFVLPGSLAYGSIAGAVIAALAPAVVLAASAAPGSLRRARSDIATVPRTRLRTVIDLTIAALAVAAIVVIVLRGPTNTGIDPLLVIAPVLVSVAASIGVLRLYPLPITLVERALARRDTSAALLGAIRGSRDPAAGLAPVLAMIVAVSVAMFAGTMIATLSAGTVAAAQERVGATVRLAGPQFIDQSIEAVRSISGVTIATPIEVIGSGTLAAGRTSIPVELVIADTAALAEQQAGTSGATPAISSSIAAAISVVVSPTLAAKIGAESDLRVGSVPVTVVSTAAVIAGSDVGNDWVLIDLADRDQLARDGFAPRVLVISTDGGEATAAVLEWAETTYGTGIQTATQSSAISDIRASPFVAGLSAALLFVIVIVAVLSAFCVVLMTTIGASQRTRLLALLRTLGFSRAQARTLIAWELAPVAIVALIAGGLLGVGLPTLVLAGVDVTPFTGGRTPPPLVVDPVTLAVTTIGFVVMIFAATLIAIAATREKPIASVLRSGEE